MVSFTSWCGGLPAPECADNPFGYKFSWSPRGVLLAALNAARFREAGQEVVVPGDQLLSSARPDPFESRLSLEGLPNRDSLRYEGLYGIGGAATMLRGTLRYRGFSELMRGYRAVGMLDQGPVPAEIARCDTWVSGHQHQPPLIAGTSGCRATVRGGWWRGGGKVEKAGCLPGQDDRVDGVAGLSVGERAVCKV